MYAVPVFITHNMFIVNARIQNTMKRTERIAALLINKSTLNKPLLANLIG